MDTCFVIPLLWALGASVLAGILGWFLARRKFEIEAQADTQIKLEHQNLKKAYEDLQETSDNKWAGLNRENAELEDKVKLWKEKFQQLQLQSSGVANDTNQGEQKIKALEKQLLEKDVEIKALIQETKSLKAKKNLGSLQSSVKTPSKTISAKAKSQYKEEISTLKGKLKKAKSQLKKLKKTSAKVREVEITKSIDIASLKKMLDKVPLKKVSERIIDRKDSK